MKKPYTQPRLTVLSSEEVLSKLGTAARAGDAIALEMLRHTGNQENPDETPVEDGPLLPLKETERRQIFRAMQKAGGNKSTAARLLGIGKTTLYRKLDRYQAESRRN